MVNKIKVNLYDSSITDVDDILWLRVGDKMYFISNLVDERKVSIIEVDTRVTEHMRRLL